MSPTDVTPAITVRRMVAWRPYAGLGAGVLAVSSAALLIRLSLDAGALALVIAMWRVALAALVVTPLVIARYRPALAALSPRQLAIGLLSGTLLGFHFACWITSLQYTSVLVSTTLVTTNPLFVALLTPVLLRERLSRTTIAAIALAVIGGAVISLTGDAGSAPLQDSPTLGAALAILGAAAAAGYFLAGRRLRGALPVIPYIWLSYSTAAVLLFVLVLITGQPILGLPGQAYFWMTLVGLIPQLIGHSMFNYALGYLSAAFVSLAVLAEPILSTVQAVLFLNETPTVWQIVGSVVILAALVLAAREESRSGA